MQNVEHDTFRKAAALTWGPSWRAGSWDFERRWVEVKLKSAEEAGATERRGATQSAGWQAAAGA